MTLSAVIGVTDQFGRLKGHLVGLLSAVTLFRWLRRMIGRAMQSMGIQPPPFFVCIVFLLVSHIVDAR